MTTALRRSGAGGLPGRTDLALFLTLFVAYAWFFQGGGWNQNGRFAQLRALVEGGTLAIDDYLFYRAKPGPDGTPQLVRRSLPPHVDFANVQRVAVSGDLAWNPASGHYYPIKPPGAVLLAVPAYAIAWGVERALGANPDRWAMVTLNAYLATLLSVGVAGALGAVLLRRLSQRLAPDLPATCHAAAALSLGLATLWLPFSTAMFDHVPAGAALLAAFACLVRVREGVASPARRSLWLLAGGAAAGLAVVINYTSALVVLLLCGYALTLRPRRAAALFALGGLPPALLLAGYHAACFGSPFTLSNAFEHASFTSEGLLLGIFGPPDPVVLWRLLVSPFRGLFFYSPVLLAALAGLVLLWRRGRRAEVAVALGAFLALWLLNGAFNVWVAGWSLGPRFLIPAIPLLALGLAPAFRRRPGPTAAVAALSALVLLAATAVDMQPPPQFSSPLTDYVWPLLRGETVAVGRYAVAGRVSANPIGFYEGWFYTAFAAGSPQVRFNSFNLGELLWPGSPLSLLPLALALVVGVAVTLRAAAAAAAGSACATLPSRSGAP